MSLKKSNICIFFHSIWKNLHLTENFYTDTVCGVCDKYEVWAGLTFNAGKLCGRKADHLKYRHSPVIIHYITDCSTNILLYIPNISVFRKTKLDRHGWMATNVRWKVVLVPVERIIPSSCITLNQLELIPEKSAKCIFTVTQQKLEIW